MKQLLLPRSRASSGDSRRSGRGGKRKARKGREEEEGVYETFRLAPLVEVVQATPTTDRLVPGLFSLTSERDTSGSSEYSMSYSDRASDMSVGSLQGRALAPALPAPQHLLYADSSPLPPAILASQESLMSTVQPVGSILCGTVRVSVQREGRRREEVEESPAYLPTRPAGGVRDMVAEARQARGLPAERQGARAGRPAEAASGLERPASACTLLERPPSSMVKAERPHSRTRKLRFESPTHPGD